MTATLTIASWNINSVRLRLPLVEKFLEEEGPDILGLQETKCRDGEFPRAALQKLGYGHQAVCGQKGWHGVAIISRVPVVALPSMRLAGKEDARHCAVEISAGAFVGVQIHNFYVPAGGDVPDPAENGKFAHKLAFLDDMRGWSAAITAQGARALMLGDFNIAPLEHDVWSHKALLDVVSHTPQEVSRLEAIMAAGNWRDAIRAHVPHSEKLYSWWSYRARDWAASNRGRRLDHIWVNPAVAARCAGMKILKAARDWERPSDHVPVVAVLALEE